MFARKDMFSSIGRAGAVATVLAVALTAVQPSSMAFAGSATSSKGVTASTGTSDATDISARRRHYRGGGGGAAAAAAFAGIVGTGIAIAATQNRRHYYDDGYYGGPGLLRQPRPVLRAARLLRRWPLLSQLVNATVKIATVKDESTGRPRPVDFYNCGPDC